LYIKNRLRPKSRHFCIRDFKLYSNTTCVSFDPKLLEGLDFDFQDPWKHRKIEEDGNEYEWQADVSTHPERSEIEMMYVFEDPEDDLFENISGVESCYECEYTEETILPLLDSIGNQTRIIAYIPVPKDIDHEISKFPSQYLEEIREDLYQQVIEPNL